MYDIAANEAGLEEMSGGDVYFVASNMHRLVGHLMPVFSQVRPPSKSRVESTSTTTRKPANRKVSELNMDPIEPLGHDGSLPRKPHAFALQPVQLSTVGDTDQGMFLAQGIIVSNKCYNFPEGDDRRVSTGRNPAFEETVCWVLVTHSYYSHGNGGGSGGGYLTYASLGPPSTKTSKDGIVRILDTPDRNLYEHLFGWKRFMEQNVDEGARKCNVSSFGFTDIKQTGKDTTRCILPWTIQDVAQRLHRMRAEGGGDVTAYLRDLPMKAALNHESDLKHRPVGGMDLRRMLLIELLLRGTPLEPLLDFPTAASLPLLPSGPRVPGGAAGLYRRMKDFCDDMFM